MGREGYLFRNRADTQCGVKLKAPPIDTMQEQHRTRATMSTDSSLRITYLTAGAAGMYCGSCMHDNTLARALVKLGVDVQLVPMYTPIRTDEADVTVDEVFFGGVNVYLQQRFGLFRYVPRFLDRILDRPGFLRWATSRGLETNAATLGELATSMLRGSAGFQRKEVKRLCQWLNRAPRPQLINLSNVLVAGCVPDLRAALRVPITVTLQGDDIFLAQLPTAYRAEALKQIGRIAEHVDAFLVHSDYYADFMADFLALPRSKFRRVPLGIDVDGFAPRRQVAIANDGAQGEQPNPELQIGYLARLAPEKGLHVLVDAFLLLHQTLGQRQPIRLRIAGWLGKQHADYAAAQFAKLDAAGLADCYEYLGTIDRPGKQRLLSQLSLFSVPAVYQEPKGLYVLEALAAGVPVVLPHHGAFPELIQATGGGQLVTPNDPVALAKGLRQLLGDAAQRHRLAQAGQEAVHAQFNAQVMAQETCTVFQQILDDAKCA